MELEIDKYVHHFNIQKVRLAIQYPHNLFLMFRYLIWSSFQIILCLIVKDVVNQGLSRSNKVGVFLANSEVLVLKKRIWFQHFNQSFLHQTVTVE